jgi:catalase
VFAEVEQAAFSPSTIVPGIGFSPDRMLQARLFAYTNAAHYRLGVNHHQIPVNAPQCPFNSFHRDGAMRVDGNHGGTVAYVPNSLGEWAEQSDFREPMLSLQGAAGHWDHRLDDDHFEQPAILFQRMTPVQQQALFDNTARALGGVSDEVQRRHVGNCAKADLDYGAGVSKALDVMKLQAALLVF